MSNRVINVHKLYETKFSGLKKVTADMQTHKNPSLRDNAPIVAPKPKAGLPPAAVAAKAAPQRPPRFELEGKKWAVEFQRNNQDLVRRLKSSLDKQIPCSDMTLDYQFAESAYVNFALPLTRF